MISGFKTASYLTHGANVYREQREPSVVQKNEFNLFPRVRRSAGTSSMSTFTSKPDAAKNVATCKVRCHFSA